jgi:hypothetical protein
LTKQLAVLLKVVNAPRAGMLREQGDVFVQKSVHGVQKSVQILEGTRTNEMDLRIVFSPNSAQKNA